MMICVRSFVMACLDERGPDMPMDDLRTMVKQEFPDRCSHRTYLAYLRGLWRREHGLPPLHRKGRG